MAYLPKRLGVATLVAWVGVACLLSPLGAQAQGKAEITFTGYQTLPGNRGIVFVQLTDPVAVEVKRAGSVIEYKFVGATVPLRNNKNPLLLADFNVSALTARLVSDKPVRGRAGKHHHAQEPASVRLVITLRGNVAPAHRMVTRGKGAVFEVELPPPAG